jgi:predicted permease
MFNICTSIVLWSVGNQAVARAAQRRAVAGSAAVAAIGTAQRITARGRMVKFYREIIAPAMSMPVQVSFLGVFVGLVPPLRWLAKEAPVTSTVMKGLGIAGDACVPLTMLSLGCSLAVQHHAKQQQKREALAAAATAAAAETAAESAREGDAAVAAASIEPHDVSNADGAATAKAPATPLAPPPTPATVPEQNARTKPFRPLAVIVPVTPTPGPSEPGSALLTNGSFAKMYLVPIQENPSFDLPMVTDEPAPRPAAPPPATPQPAEAPEVAPAPEAVQEMRDVIHLHRHPTASCRGTAVAGAVASPLPADVSADDLMLLFGVAVRKPSAWSQQVRFTIAVAVVRMFMMPVMAFLGMWACGMRPEPARSMEPGASFAIDKYRLMILLMILESLSPAAVNGGIICTLHAYYPERHARMLAVQYLVCVVPCVMWLFVGLWFLG